MRTIKANLVAFTAFLTSLYAVFQPNDPTPPAVPTAIKVGAGVIPAPTQTLPDALDRQFDDLLRLNARLAKAAEALQAARAKNPLPAK